MAPLTGVCCTADPHSPLLFVINLKPGVLFKKTWPYLITGFFMCWQPRLKMSVLLEKCIIFVFCSPLVCTESQISWPGSSHSFMFFLSDLLNARVSQVFYVWFPVLEIIHVAPGDKTGMQCCNLRCDFKPEIVWYGCENVPEFISVWRNPSRKRLLSFGVKQLVKRSHCCLFEKYNEILLILWTVFISFILQI